MMILRVYQQKENIVDYICTPYEDLDSIRNFKVNTMSSIINEIDNVPDSIPDHSLLFCEFEILHICGKNNNANTLQNDKFNFKQMPYDFLINEEIHQDIYRTIERIEQYIVAESDIQNAYDEFET